jgi:hypothetical protein
MTARMAGPGRFRIGKYEVIAEPLPYAGQMLRYTVHVGKTRIGAMVSVPSESDCRFMENPPAVPPLKIFYVTSKPGRPKKDAKPPAVLERNQPGFREEIPPDVSLDGLGKPGNR